MAKYVHKEGGGRGEKLMVCRPKNVEKLLQFSTNFKCEQVCECLARFTL